MQTRIGWLNLRCSPDISSNPAALPFASLLISLSMSSTMLSEGLIRIGTSHLRHSPFTLSTVSFSNLCKYIAHRIHSCLHCGSHTSSLSSVLTVISNSTEQHSTQSLLYIFITIYGSTRKNIQIEYTYM